MSNPSDLRIELGDASPADLADAVGRIIGGSTIWRRDGILEEQVSTREDVQYCFRNEPPGDRPRTALCIAGTPEILTVATVVPIDRGIELTDEEYAAVVTDFRDEVLQPATEAMSVTTKPVTDP